MSGHRKKSTDRAALTSWRRQRERLVRTPKEIDRPSALTCWRRQREQLVRTPKEIDQPSRTHFLETAEGVTCQDTRRDRPTEPHSRAGDGRGSDLSGHRKKSTDRAALTIWRRHRERLVRTPKEIDRPRRTHELETGEGATCQDTERNRQTKPHSLAGDGRGSNLSGHRKKSTDRAHSLAGDGRGSDLSGHRKRSTNRAALTSWRRQRERLVRTPKEIGRPSRTHFLETGEGVTCQDTERNRPTEPHSLAGDGRGSDLSGHRKKSTDRAALTSWRRERE